MLLGMLLLSGCKTSDPLSGERDPKDPWWSLDFMAPSYMIGVVEHSAVEDINGKLFNRPGGGAIGTSTPSLGTESARGWRGMAGNVIPVTGADLPKRIYVRWQSVVEPQT